MFHSSVKFFSYFFNLEGHKVRDVKSVLTSFKIINEILVLSLT
jgi:hypothetical protein